MGYIIDYKALNYGYIIYGVKDIVGISDAKGTLLSCVCMYMLLLSFFWCVPVIICPWLA